MSNNYANIPAELRQFNQWIVWRIEPDEDGKPTKVPYSVSGHKASVTNNAHWSSFDQAVKTSLNGGNYNGIGFVLTEADPFTFIDLDDPFATNPNGTPKHKQPDKIVESQIRIYNEFASYAERSPSGSGLHIIVKGKVPSGRRRNAVEVYSNERYMTVTGDVYRNAPIVDANGTLQALWLEMAKDAGELAAYYAGTLEESCTDQEVIQRALAASNSEKFKNLYNGQWQLYYPSQSEADFALVDMLAFFTKSKAQITRIFRSSALGERKKAQRDDYMRYMLDRCFDRTLPPVDIDNLQNQIAEVVAESKRKKKEPVEQSTTVQTPKAYTVPPGLLGEIAQFIYAAAPRPVPEIALVGAIGLMCGIVGRCYNVSGTGLNQYVLLLAPTGTGKEAIASGIEKLMTAVVRTVPAAVDFVGPAEIASSQALTKYLSRTAPSFVSILGEFGLTLQTMSMPYAPAHLVSLRRLFLDLFNKSGEGQQLRPTIYSDKEKNTQSIASPAFSLIGESTPARFYQALSEDMIEEGLLPRFLTIEYNGPRPPLNEDRIQNPPFQLIDRLGAMCAQALMLNSQQKVIHVKNDPSTERLFKAFDKYCDDKINGSASELTRQLWNRAHVKAMKLSALVAIGCNPFDPIIDESSANWAISIVIDDIERLHAKFEEGSIGDSIKGSDEDKQLRAVIKWIRAYVLDGWDKWQGISTGNQAMHSDKIIPLSTIQRRCTNLTDFKKDKLGATAAIKRTFKNLVDAGALREVDKATLAAKYQTSAIAYAIANPRYFDL
ncbi:MAG TPA: hypothetical protein VHK27_01965 [Gammaproteobacteria bacterium]|nr:hypothetical protein [Gammaproteobacteria bacterium]